MNEQPTKQPTSSRQSMARAVQQRRFVEPDVARRHLRYVREHNWELATWARIWREQMGR
ncbi:MAG: hypothetical protein IRY83_14980 [Chloroflexi bacterium]|nr:hypothetical protein [Chloroflexota bacterium]